MKISDIQTIWWTADDPILVTATIAGKTTGKLSYSVSEDENGDVVRTEEDEMQLFTANVPASEIEGLDDPIEVLKQAVIDQN